MNCHNHPNKEATAICVSCGQGLCNDCTSPENGLCVSCYQKSLYAKVSTAIFYIAILAIIGIIGYIWDPMGHEGMDNSEASCYMLMATCTGIFLISGKIRIPAIAFLAGGVNNVGLMMLLVLLVKFIIAVILGSLLLPFIILWQIYVIVKNFNRIRYTERLKECVVD